MKEPIRETNQTENSKTKKHTSQKIEKQNQSKKTTSPSKPKISRIVDIETAEDGLYCYAQIIVYEHKEETKDEVSSKIHWKSEGLKFLKSNGEDGFINCWTALSEEISKEMDMPIETCVKALTMQHFTYFKKGKNLSGNDYPKQLTSKDFPTDDGSDKGISKEVNGASPD